MDHYELFDRKVATPMLVLDGHGSRFGLEFMDYINNISRWRVCIGVPYGTAYWQVGDAKQQNGSFNIQMTKSKSELVRKKEELLIKPVIKPTDLVPLINKAWKASFA